MPEISRQVIDEYARNLIKYDQEASTERGERFRVQQLNSIYLELADAPQSLIDDVKRRVQELQNEQREQQLRIEQEERERKEKIARVREQFATLGR